MNNSTREESEFIIGEWTVLPNLNLIRNGETEVQLVPKVMRLLLCLADNAEKPVSQEVLFAEVWPDQVVSDSSLYQAVAQLRKALGDNGKQKEYIERVSSQGYRLMKPVQAESSSERFSLADSPKLIQLAIFAVLAIFTWAYFSWQSTGSDKIASKQHSEEIASPRLNIEQVDSLAVLKFELDERQLGQSPLSAFNDLLLTQLGHVQDLKVVSIDNDNERVQVKAILTGKVVLEGEQARLFLRLEQANNREVIWAKVFSGSQHRLFELQDEVTSSLLQLFNKARSGETFSNQKIDSQVFERYLMARHFWEKRNAESLVKAKKILESLRDEQQLFPLAAVTLCETYHFLYLYSDWTLEQVDNQCRPLLDLALEKSPQLGQAIAAKALLMTSFGDRQLARDLFEQAIHLSPNYALGYLWYGNLLRALGEYQLALTASLKAFELAPMSPIINRSLAYSYLNLRNVDKANYYYERAIALEPNYIHRPIGDLDFYPLTRERAKSFLQWAKQNPRAFERDSVYQLNQAQVLLAIGEVEKAESIVKKFEASQLNPSFTQYVKATVEISKGEFDKAAETFDRRRQFSGEKERLDMPYIQALMMVGEYRKAYDLAIQWFPEFNSPDVKVTKDKLFRAIFFAQLKNFINPELNQKKLFAQIDELIKPEMTSASIQVAEWLAFRKKDQEAYSMILDLMASGWLPDTNSEPFAHHRMKRLFIETGLGEKRFESLLDENQRILEL